MAKHKPLKNTRARVRKNPDAAKPKTYQAVMVTKIELVNAVDSDRNFAGSVGLRFNDVDFIFALPLDALMVIAKTLIARHAEMTPEEAQTYIDGDHH